MRKRLLLSPNQATQGQGPLLVPLAAVLQHLSISIQNCNSLNMSTSCPKQTKKIKSLIDLGSEIIFLSDIRLNNRETVNDVEKIFLCSNAKQYKFLHNSTQSKRGVGILISTSLDCTIGQLYKDVQENILGVELSISEHNFLLVSIYGPNSNCNYFFQNLSACILQFPNHNVIIGGDWNLTHSTADVPDNIDVFRMTAPPSLARSRNLADLAERLHLSDPFRALHPDKLDFTFRPRSGQLNRSRLDFFLISENLLRFVSTCEISTEISNDLFDHHYVTLNFNAKKFKNKQSINPCILSNPMFPDVLAAAVADCHLQHAHVINPGVNIAEGKVKVGECLALIRNINDLEYDISLNGFTEIKNITKLGFKAELKEKIENLPDPDQLAEIALSCDDDIFLEALMGSIKSSIISFQSWVFKISTAKKSQLIRKINSLRDDFLINADEISHAQRELNDIVNFEVSEKIKSMKLFEGLNSEKPSSLFLSLAKSKNFAKLSRIKDDNGRDFRSETERGEYIANFYENLYKKKPDEPENFDNIIENFLGEDILNSRIVQNSKLSPRERDNMETPLTLLELDHSLKKANFRSAAGIDGFSNTLIKKCWKFLRIPLLKYANTCLAKGTLTANFRGASIRLIPKKNNLENLKNWRPISLLSNMYKILSRALNERLNKIVNRISSRAQKGFNKNRYTQEVLINVWETIQKCQVGNVDGAVMAIDMAKAFDTLSNKFLDSVLKFFGFGPVMRSWLKLIGHDRTACIILEDGGF